MTNRQEKQMNKVHSFRRNQVKAYKHSLYAKRNSFNFGRNIALIEIASGLGLVVSFIIK